jgi:hypothetical protein
MDTQAILYCGAAATIPCVIFDLIIDAIQSWQRKRAGVTDVATFGWFGRTLMSLVINALLCSGFAALYSVVGAGSGNSFLVGGFLWLMVSVPLLATSRYQDDIQKRVLATRILGWLFKTGAASASAAIFIDKSFGILS